MGKPDSREKGFSLMELLITILIISIVMAIAIPVYQNYRKKTYYAEILHQIDPYKTAVMLCFNNMGNFNTCQAGSNGVPPNIINTCNGRDIIKELSVGGGQQLTIRAVPCARNGILTTDYYDLKPTVGANSVVWTGSGVAVDKGYAPAR